MGTRNKILASAILGALAIPSAHATNGFFSHGYGTINKALAGAGVAVPQGSISAANNPATMAFVGNQWDAGIELFAPRRSFESGAFVGQFPNGNGAGNKVESQNDWFFIPSFGYSLDLGGGNNFGVSVYGNGGLNAGYNQNDTAGGAGVLLAGKFDIDFAQFFSNFSFSSQLSPTSAWGASVILAVQAIKVRGLDNFAGFTESAVNAGFNAAAADDFTSQGRDYAFGAGVKVGYTAEIASGWTLGLSAQSKIYMTEFDDYSDLLAESGDFDNPATATIGMAWKVTPNSTFLLDYQYIWFSEVDALGNHGSNILDCPAVGGADASSCFGGNNGAGFGWSNAGVIKLGWEWEANPEWTWRVGFAHVKQPIPDSETLLNILAPAVIENHITFGFTKRTGKNSDFNLSAMYAPKSNVTGTTFAFGAQEVELEMHQYAIEVSWTQHF